MAALEIPGEERPLEIFLMVNGQQHGPYTDAELQHYLSTGQVAPDALAWWQGLPGWEALKDLPRFEKSVPALAAPQAPPSSQATSRGSFPRSAMKCLAIALWLAAVAVCVTVAVPVMFELQIAGVSGASKFMLFVSVCGLMASSLYLLFQCFCRQYFAWSGMGALVVAALIVWPYAVDFLFITKSSTSRSADRGSMSSAGVDKKKYRVKSGIESHEQKIQSSINKTVSIFARILLLYLPVLAYFTALNFGLVLGIEGVRREQGGLSRAVFGTVLIGLLYILLIAWIDYLGVVGIGLVAPLLVLLFIQAFVMRKRLIAVIS